MELQVSAQSTRDKGWFENLKSQKAALAELLGSRTQGPINISENHFDPPSKFFFSLGKKERTE